MSHRKWPPIWSTGPPVPILPSYSDCLFELKFISTLIAILLKQALPMMGTYNPSSGFCFYQQLNRGLCVNYKVYFLEMGWLKIVNQISDLHKTISIFWVVSFSEAIKTKKAKKTIFFTMANIPTPISCVLSNGFQISSYQSKALDQSFLMMYFLIK